MSTIVIGGGGFIGGHLSRELVSQLERNEKLVLYDLYPALDGLTDIKDKIVLERGDVLDLPKLAEVFKMYRVSKIFYLVVHMRGAETELYKAAQINVIGFHNVFELARLFDVNKIVWASSVAVYGTPSSDVAYVDEQYPPNPDTVYGMCKMYEEFMARQYFKVHGVPNIAIRPSMVFGPLRFYNPVGFDIRIFENPAKGLPVTVSAGDLPKSVNWSYVKDVAHAFALAMANDGVKYGIYNVGGETETMRGIMDIVKGFIPSTKFEVKPAEHVQASRYFDLNWEKVRKELNYSPLYGLRNGIKDYLDSLVGQVQDKT